MDVRVRSSGTSRLAHAVAMVAARPPKRRVEDGLDEAPTRRRGYENDARAANGAHSRGIASTGAVDGGNDTVKHFIRPRVSTTSRDEPKGGRPHATARRGDGESSHTRGRPPPSTLPHPIVDERTRERRMQTQTWQETGIRVGPFRPVGQVSAKQSSLSKRKKRGPKRGPTTGVGEREDVDILSARKNSKNSAWCLKRLHEFYDVDGFVRVRMLMSSKKHGVEFAKILKALYSCGGSSLDFKRWMEWILHEAPIYDELLMKINSAADFVELCSQDPSILWTTHEEVRSTLTADERAFSCSDENIIRALFSQKEAEKLVNGGDTKRKFLVRLRSARLVYVYALRIEGRWHLYVGESTDVEVRISVHLRTAFGNRRTKQNAHKRIQLYVQHKGLARENWLDLVKDLIAMGDLVIATPGGGGVRSNVQALGQSYMNALAQAGIEGNAIEVATAVGSAQFIREALWTSALSSWEGANSDGLNSSQPATRYEPRRGVSGNRLISRYETMSQTRPEWSKELVERMHAGMSKKDAIQHIFAAYMRKAWIALNKVEAAIPTLSARGGLLHTVREQKQQVAMMGVVQKNTIRAYMHVQTERGKKFTIPGVLLDPTTKITREYKLRFETQEARVVMKKMVEDEEIIAMAEKFDCTPVLEVRSSKFGGTSKHSVHFPLAVIEQGETRSFNNLLAQGVEAKIITVDVELPSAANTEEEIIQHVLLDRTPPRCTL